MVVEHWVDRNTKVPFKKMLDYVTHTAVKKKSSSAQPHASSKSSSAHYPITHYVSCEFFF